MDFSENLFTGSIPAEIGSLNYLWGLALDSNQFSGTIPIEIGELLFFVNVLYDADFAERGIKGVSDMF